MKKSLKWIGGILAGIILLLVALSFCAPKSVENITTAKTPRPEVTLKRYRYDAPPMGGDTNYLYAELNWNGSHDRQLIMYTDLLVLGPITWVRPDKMVICVTQHHIKEAEFHSKVTLSAGGRTVDLYAELKGDCPDWRLADEPL